MIYATLFILSSVNVSN